MNQPGRGLSAGDAGAERGRLSEARAAVADARTPLGPRVAKGDESDARVGCVCD